MTQSASTPMMNGSNDETLWGSASMRLAHSGAKRLWSGRSATPRQPNSSIGPISSVMPNAGDTSYQGKNGNSVIVPLLVAPKYDDGQALTPMRLR